MLMKKRVCDQEAPKYAFCTNNPSQMLSHASEEARCNYHKNYYSTIPVKMSNIEKFSWLSQDPPFSTRVVHNNS